MTAFRPYQDDLNSRLKASVSRSVLVQLVTGGGKSLLLAAAVRRFRRVLVLVHAEWLVDQLAERIDGQVIKAGGQYDGSSVVVGMVQTIARRDLPEFDAVIIDEAHHSPAKSFKTIIDKNPNAKIIGFTATPARLDGVGLDDIFDELICGPQPQKLIEDGWLKPFEHFSVPSGVDISKCKVRAGDYAREDVKDAVRKSTILGDVVEHYLNHCRELGGHASFWSSIEFAEQAAEEMRAKGVACWALHSKMPRDEIKKLIAGLRSGSVESLATVGMLGEGLDVPGLGSASLCRPSKSLTIFLQQCGRTNRGGKGVARIMDHVQNWQRHGLPDDEREWSLRGIVRRRAEPGVLGVWDCPECWAINRSQWQACHRCGANKPREIVLIEQRAAELELIERTSINDIHEHCKTGEDYVRFAKAKGKKPSFGVLRYWERTTGFLDDPFLMAIEKTVKPSLQQFVLAAKQCGVNEHYAEQAGKAMRLEDQPIDYKAMFT